MRLLCILLVVIATTALVRASSLRASDPVASFVGLWVKHDRSSSETFLINVTRASPPFNISGTYLTGPLSGRNTWNVTLVGDALSGIIVCPLDISCAVVPSGTGYYA